METISTASSSVKTGEKLQAAGCPAASWKGSKTGTRFGKGVKPCGNIRFGSAARRPEPAAGGASLDVHRRCQEDLAAPAAPAHPRSAAAPTWKPRARHARRPRPAATSLCSGFGMGDRVAPELRNAIHNSARSASRSSILSPPIPNRSRQPISFALPPAGKPSADRAWWSLPPRFLVQAEGGLKCEPGTLEPHDPQPGNTGAVPAGPGSLRGNVPRSSPMITALWRCDSSATSRSRVVHWKLEDTRRPWIPFPAE